MGTILLLTHPLPCIILILLVRIPAGFEPQMLTAGPRLGPHALTTAGASGIIHILQNFPPKRWSRTMPPFSMPAQNLEQVHSSGLYG